jgi:hypothetical protein
VFLLGFLEKLVFRRGVFVDKLWWNGWVRWFVEWLVLGDGFFADFWDLFLGEVLWTPQPSCGEVRSGWGFRSGLS